MEKISTGIKDLDILIDFAHIGDNVVWEVEAGTSEETFIQNFVRSALSENQDVIYISFNKSPQSLLLNMNMGSNTGKMTLVDCFTWGKGKGDHAFLKFYSEDRSDGPKTILVEQPQDISFFCSMLNDIEDSLPVGARYVFDSLTGMQDLWGDEAPTYKFFTYTCPRLYDLGTVAYWMIEKEAHSQSFKANIRHITQVVLELYRRREKLFLKALKLANRTSREAFKPHPYEVVGTEISILSGKKEPSLNIGSGIKARRINLGLSQKDLADKIGVTSSFISQVENNQISPSLASFLMIADVLGISPSHLLSREKQPDDASWLIRQEQTQENIIEKQNGFTLYSIFVSDKGSAYRAFFAPDAELNRHLHSSKKEELIHVISGNVTVKIDSRDVKLGPGDSLHLKEAVPTRWENRSGTESELLVICF